jgi:LacI family transcriptional regulator
LDSRLIEIVLGTFNDAWTSGITAGAREAAFRLGYDLVLTLERSDPGDDWPTRVATRRPSGVILGLIKPTARQLDKIQGLRIPIVLLEPRTDTASFANVAVTNRQGGYDAGAHLVACGYSRFVIVNGVPRYRFGRAREEGFRSAIEELKPGAPVIRVDSEWSDAPLSESLLRSIAGDGSPVGAFACDDEMAFAVYRTAAQLKRRIPEDIGVVGFNDEARATVATPPLTSVRQPLRAIGGRAVELLAEVRRHDEQPHRSVEVPSELIVRSSTGPVA